MQIEGQKRVVVERIYPDIDCGRFPAKRVIGEALEVRADIFTDGHDEVSARMLYRGPDETAWTPVFMRHTGNDLWSASFVPDSLGIKLADHKSFPVCRMNTGGRRASCRTPSASTPTP